MKVNGFDVDADPRVPKHAVFMRPALRPGTVPGAGPEERVAALLVLRAMATTTFPLRSDWMGYAIAAGLPAGMGSKRIGRNRKGDPIILDDDDSSLRNFQRRLARSGDRTTPTRPLPPGTPVVMLLRVTIPRPKGHYGTGRNAEKLLPSAPAYPAAGRDLDKTQRAVGDALTAKKVPGRDERAGGWFCDDQQIRMWLAERVYCSHPQDPPRTEVWAWVMK